MIGGDPKRSAGWCFVLGGGGWVEEVRGECGGREAF